MAERERKALLCVSRVSLWELARAGVALGDVSMIEKSTGRVP